MGFSTHCGNLRGRGKHFREARQAVLRETALFSPSFLSLNLHTNPRPPGRSGPSACDWSQGGWRAPRAFSAPVARGQAAHTHRRQRTSDQHTALSSPALPGAGASPPTPGSVHPVNPASPVSVSHRMMLKIPVNRNTQRSISNSVKFAYNEM